MQGKTTVGKTTVGKTTRGKTTRGKTTAGKTTGGKTTVGKTTGGKTSGGKTTGGKTTGGKTTVGKTSGGKTTAGKTTAGKTTAGKTSRGKTTERRARGEKLVTRTSTVSKTCGGNVFQTSTRKTKSARKFRAGAYEFISNRNLKEKAVEESELDKYIQYVNDWYFSKYKQATTRLCVLFTYAEQQYSIRIESQYRLLIIALYRSTDCTENNELVHITCFKSTDIKSYAHITYFKKDRNKLHLYYNNDNINSLRDLIYITSEISLIKMNDYLIKNDMLNRDDYNDFIRVLELFIQGLEYLFDHSKTHMNDEESIYPYSVSTIRSRSHLSGRSRDDTNSRTTSQSRNDTNSRTTSQHETLYNQSEGFDLRGLLLSKKREDKSGNNRGYRR